MMRTSIVLLALALTFMPDPARAIESDGTAPGADSAAVKPPPERAVRAWQVGLLRPDRLEHASLSFTLALGGGVASGHSAAAAGGALALGLAKEVRDRRHGGFDAVDLLADVVGAGLAAWAAERLTR